MLGSPRQIGRVADRTDRNPITVDRQALFVEFDTAIEGAMYAVVLEQVRVDRAIAQVVDSDDLQVLTVALGIECPQDVTTDSAKTIDCDTKRHKHAPLWFCCLNYKIFS